MRTKRFFAWILTLAMLMSFVPNYGMVTSAEGASTLANEPTVTQIDSKENTNQASGIVYTKTSTAKSDGTVDITLTAHTTGEVKQLTSVSPTDIVLVLDVSGSMDDNYSTTSESSGAVLGDAYTYDYFFGFISFTAYGLEDTDGNYYINTGTEEEPIYTTVTYTGRDSNRYEMYEYSTGNNEVIVYPKLEDGVPADREYSYNVVQFYKRTTTVTTMKKMDSLQNAVNAFIDTTKKMNEGLATADMHTISIIKFADDSYYRSSTPTIAEGNNRGAGGNSSYNYSQVVKDLTPVDDAGAAVLKDAVNSLVPGGATAVDYGLNLAEAVLMNRSAVVEDGAVDRNEVIIVFTDGEPNYSNNFNPTTANNAIETAGYMKNTAGVTVYGVCIDTDADATDLDANINKFMHYMSSNFPNATSMNNAGEGGSINNGYYMTPDESHSLSMIFESIIQEIDHPTVKMGEEATMVDTLSPYFNFIYGDATTVKLQTSARNADGSWADPVDDPTLTYEIHNDRLEVNGFDFDKNFVSATGRGDNNDFYGKRLVVTFTVLPDYDVIDIATVTNGELPTNSGFASLVDSDSTPAAEVTTPVLSAHQVVYKVDGSEYVTYNRFTGSDVTVDSIPTKEGYTFSGWTINGNKVDPADVFEMPDYDVEILGSFTLNTHTVKYEYSTTPPANAPALPASHPQEYGTEVTVAQPLTLQGYIFVGWDPLQADVEIDDNGKFTMPDKNVTLVGRFESSTTTPYTVKHYLETLTDGVYETDPVHEETFYGTTNNSVSATPLNRFTGFTYNAGVSTASGVIRADGKLVLELYYDRNEYTVTYGYEGDTQIDDLPTLPQGGTYKYGETVTVADKATPPAGYAFTGWYRGTTNNPVENSFTMPDYDVHLLGFFTASGTIYTVEHYLMDTDGNYPTDPELFETLHGTTGHTATATPNTTFEGFTYNAGVSTASGTIQGDGSLVLKLYYDRMKYTVTYEYERTVPTDAIALLPSEADYYHGDIVTLADEPYAEGYTFGDWHFHVDTINVSNGTFEMPMRDVTVYGYFTANTDTPYTVEHYVEKVDGSGYETTPYTIQNLSGTTGIEVEAKSIVIEGFTYNASVSTTKGVIVPDGGLVLKLYYDRNEYTVTYEYEGDIPDTAPVPPTQTTHSFGEKVVAADVADAPDGYTFIGWYRGEVNNIVTEFTMPARNVTLTGYFKPNEATKYMVEHYLMDTDGNYPSDPAVFETLYGTTGHTATTVPLAIFEGFTYNAGESTASGTIVGDGSLVLKLYYDRIKYTVTYEYERDLPARPTALPAPTSYYHGETVNIAGNAYADGYTFSGWHVHADTIDVDNSTFEMPMRDVTIYGYFTANTDTPYTVEHYVEKVDGSGYETTPYTIQNLSGTTGIEVEAKSIVIEGFTYNAGVSTTKGVIVPDGGLVLKLYYDRNEYTVTYEYEGDIPDTAPVPPTQTTHSFGEKVVAADVADAPDGYTFIGWYRGEVNNIVTEFTMPARDVTLTGYFQPAENTPYAVHHYLETLTDGEYESTPVLVDDSFSGKTGHRVTATPLNRFTGFTYNATKSASTISGEIKADGTLVLKVYYDRNQYNVTYGYDGDIPAGAPALPAGGSYAYGATVTVANIPDSPLGYTFVGWYRGTEDNHIFDSFIMPNYDVHILGNFEQNTNTPYRVEHYLQNEYGDGYVINGKSDVRHGVTGEQVSALPKEFPGFTYNASISNASGTVASDGTLVLKFYYDRHTHNVTYIYEGKLPDGAPAAPAGISGVYYDSFVVVEEDPVVNGYTFSGWETTDATINAGIFHMPDKDVVLKGSFRSNEVEYKVNYWFQKIDAHNTFNPADYELNSSSYERVAFVGQHVEADRKAVSGFYVNTAHSNSYGHVTVDENGEGNLVLNIYFDRHTYKVTYGYYGEQPSGAPDVSVNDIARVRYGATVNVADKPVLNGYAFDGWYTHTATVENRQFTMPNHDVELLGRFQLQLSVSYDLNGGIGAPGTDYGTEYVSSGTEITVKTAPSRSGYTFAGWSEAGTFYAAGDDVTVERNMTFVARWSPIGGGTPVTPKYTLTYETNGGNKISSETYSSGKIVSLIKVPVKEGYVFEGWYLDKDLTVDVDVVHMDKDITVYAAWVKDNGNAGHGHDTPDPLNGNDHFAYVVGYPDGTVRPNANISRAEVTTIFFRLLKPDALRDDNLTSDNKFTDVNAGDWFNTPVSTMAKLGIVNGRTANGFAPDDFITRAEFATICARFDNSEYEIADSFTDISGHWAEADIHEAAAHGWIRGYEDGTFKPDQFITRAEAITMINRVLNRIPESADDLLENMIVWPDNSDVNAWYYLPIQEATNSHLYNMKNHIYEEWTELKKVTDWTKYEQ